MGDNSTVVNWLNGDTSVRGLYRPIIAKILEWCNMLYNDGVIAPRATEASWFTHVYREHNKAADCLATIGILQQQSSVMFNYHLDGIPQYIRIQFDGGFRGGVSGSGVQVLCAAALGHDMQPTWKTAWCASIFISNQNDSTSLDAEFLGAERSIAAAVSLATTGIIRVDNTFNIIWPVYLRHHAPCVGRTPQ